MAVDVKIILLGNIKERINKEYLKNWESDLFRIVEINEMNINSTKFNGVELSTEFIQDDLKNLDGLNIAIGDYYLAESQISIRINKNLILLSVYDLENLLNSNHIKLEKFLLRFIYSFAIIYETNQRSLPSYTELIHPQIEGCIFDYCKRHTDLIKFHDNPKLSNYSKTKIESKPTPNNFIKIIESEIQKLKLSYLEKIELFVQKKPGLTRIISILLGFILSLIIK